MAGATIEAFANTFDAYAKHTVLLPSVLTEQADALAANIGFESDQIRYMIGMLIAIPLGFVFAALPSATAKHLFSLVVGVAVAQFVFASQWVHPLMSSAIVYGILLLGRAVPAIGRKAHVLVFLFMMGYMSLCHVYRIWVDYMGWTLDFTGPQMLLTIKLTSLAYNLFDGTHNKGYLKEKLDNNPGRLERVYQGMVNRSIDRVPSVIEFFGYGFNFSSFLAGPAFEIREYLEVASGAKFAKERDGVPPSRWASAISLTIQGFVYLALMVVGGAKYPLSTLYDPAELAVAKTGVLGFLTHCGRAYLSLFFVRCKYYFGWLLSEGGSVFAGFGFEGRDKEGNVKGWRGCRNMDVIGFEFATNVSQATRAWNQRTQAWLERTVYHRTNRSLMKVYMVSAFWHGFYPGYYLFFLSAPIATAVARVSKAHARPRFLEDDGKTAKSTKVVYDAISYICTAISMNYLASAFQALSWDRAITVWASFYFAGHIAMALLYVGIPLVFPKPKKDKKHTQ